MGATARVVVPAFWDAFQAEGYWRKLAWWIHDHLPYSSLYFFPKFWAVNIAWRQEPERRIDSYTSLSGARVARELDAIIAMRGKPLMIVSETGPS